MLKLHRSIPPVLALSAAFPGCASAPAVSTAPPQERFVLRTEDGRSELALGGLFQTTANVYDGDRDPSNDIVLKRMRPEFTGRVAEVLRFALETKFDEDEVELEEAWVGVDLDGGDARLMIGRMKAPFNLEEVRSRRHIDFPAFSIVNQFAPAEDHGFFLNGRSDGGFLEYGLAAYNGTGASDTNSSKDVAARAMVHPFHDDEGSAWQNLQLGFATTWGSQEEDVGGDAIENEVGLEVVRFAPGLELDGDRVRVGLEAAWFDGPWFAQAEWVAVEQEMSTGSTEEDIDFRGAYVDISHVLTGESKSFDGVDPAVPYDFAAGNGRGAWILALRLSQLDLDDDLALPGFTPAGEFTDRIRSASLGLNWVPNRNAIVRHALIYSEYDDEVRLDDGTGDDELAFVVEFQLHF